MKNKDIDKYISEKAKEDVIMSEQAQNIVKSFEENFVLKGDKEMEKRVIRISFGKFIAIAACLVLAGFTGINIYAHANGKANAISSIQALFRNEDKEDTDKIAKELFEKSFYALRDMSIYEADLESGTQVHEKNGIVYVRTKEAYTKEKLEKRYGQIFTGDVLEKVIDRLFCNVDGITYQIATAGPGYWLEGTEVEKVREEKNGDLVYKVTFKIAFIDTPKVETESCIIIIRKGNEGYRISETEYWGSLGNGSAQDNTEKNEEKLEAEKENKEENIDKNNEKTENKIEETKNNTGKSTENNTNKQSTLCGDVNCDGEVNGKDLIAIRKYVESGIALTEQGKENADVNDDETVTRGDVEILRQYLVGNYKKLPYRISGETFTTKDVPGMKVKYPTSWTVSEVNKNRWYGQAGEASCTFKGTVNNVKVTVTTYEPCFNTGGYENLFKKECEKYGRQYNETIGGAGFNVGSTDPNYLEWRTASMTENTHIYYHMIDSNSGIAVKVEAKYDTSAESNILPAARVVDDMILGTVITSY